MTVQYLINLMKYIIQSLMFSGIVHTSQTSICNNLYMISQDQNDFQIFRDSDKLHFSLSFSLFLYILFLLYSF